MKRGDVVVVAAAGDYGKPRPAIVVQTNAFPETHASVVICPIFVDASHGRQARYGIGRLNIAPAFVMGRRLTSLRGYRPAAPRTAPRTTRGVEQPFGFDKVRRSP